MKSSPAILPAEFRNLLSTTNPDLVESAEEAYVDPEGAYPHFFDCPCGMGPFRITLDHPRPIVQGRKVAILRLDLDQRTFLLIGRCASCRVAYWCVLNWSGNRLDPGLPDLEAQLATWGEGLNQAREREKAFEDLLRETKGKILGPPVPRIGAVADGLERAGFIGLYSLVRPENLTLITNLVARRTK
jgi:hypothetical protein